MFTVKQAVIRAKYFINDTRNIWEWSEKVYEYAKHLSEY